LGPSIFLSSNYTKLEKDKQMEIVNTFVEMAFGLLLASLIIIPSLVGLVRKARVSDYRAEKLSSRYHEARRAQRAARFAPAVPFNYPQ
jgi:hypothetical protein